MIALERIRCTNCGGEFEEYDPGASVMRCSREGCKASFIIRQAAAFAKVLLDHDQDIRTLRRLLSEALRSKDSIALRERATDIRKWIPDDFFAGFCEALARKLQGKPAEYYSFLQAPHDGHMTEEARDEVLDIALDNFKIHDKDPIQAFIQRNYKKPQAAEKTAILEDIVRRLYEEQNRYAEIPREIFICHSSSDKDIALQVYDRLIADGNTCWISVRNLPPETTNYWDRISSAIRGSRIILVISSLQCMLREDTQREMRLAREIGLLRLEYKIDDSNHTSFFKYFFDGLQWINGEVNTGKAMDQLCDRIYWLLNPEQKIAEMDSPVNPPEVKDLAEVKPAENHTKIIQDVLKPVPDDVSPKVETKKSADQDDGSSSNPGIDRVSKLPQKQHPGKFRRILKRVLIVYLCLVAITTIITILANIAR